MRRESRRGGQETGDRWARCAGLAVALGLGVAAATGHGVAWADTPGGDAGGGSVSHSGSATGTGASAGLPSTGPSLPSVSTSATSSSAAKGSHTHTGTSAGIADTSPTKVRTPDLTFGSARLSDTPFAPFVKADAESPAGTSSVNISTPPAEPGSAALQQDSPAADPTAATTTANSLPIRTSATHLEAVVADPAPAPPPGLGTPGPARSPSSARTGIAPVAVTPTAAVVATTPPSGAAPLSPPAVNMAPSPPGPVSPIANIVALPGRIVNAVLQLLEITTAADIAPSPISWDPLSDLLWGLFRRWEHELGLDSPLSGQPVPPGLTYTGSLTTFTPTVRQFLNAATAEYVLGGTPGDLVPFTVDGWPMTSTNTFTGMAAQVWVTPDSQVIIAYSGTTGGTNLLFNPLIALAQIVTDLQGAFTDTTPQAFVDALVFAQQVQAEAARQGYPPTSIFVTGHSLGAWEAQYVAQQIGLSGIGFEGPGLSTTVPGNGADSLFVNTATYGDVAAYMASDLPGLQPFAPAYVPAGGTKPHYGPIVMLGDPSAVTPMVNAAALWGTGIVESLTSAVGLLGNFLENHLPDVQAYNLDVIPDPGVVPWLGVDRGPINAGFGDLTIPEFLAKASAAGILVVP